ncbi:MAG: Ig-like domain-containing protein, partial [Planctomycetes bacterium]|nr:Ig-like domain-containing protein [Planctomycetota bacterium]
TASFAGASDSAAIEVTAATLDSIDVTPSHPAAALGTLQAFTATGTYTDGTTQELTTAATWSTSSSAIATVSNAGGSHGLATTVAVGTATITAALGGVSGSTTFTVSAADLVEIAVSPDVASIAKGTTLAFSALALFTDGTRQILTDQVTWSSSDDGVAAVSNAAASRGLVTGVEVGSVTLTASFAGASDSAAIEVTAATLDSIDVTPFAASIARGTELQFWAQGNYSDGSTQDLTSEVTWSSSNSNVATISNAAGSRGLATGADMGTATITAALAGVSESVELEVTAAVLDSIQVTPENPSVPAGASHAFRALGLFSDGGTQDITELVTWSSSDPTVATVSNAAESKGLVQCVRNGTTQVGATLSGKSTTTTLTVTAKALASIDVSPAPASVPAGFSLTLRAVGAYTDGSTRDLTAEVVWTSSNPCVARVSNSAATRGRATGRVPGTATITATLAERSGSTLLTVTNETLSSIVLEPANVVLSVGGTQPMLAWGHFSNGSVVDVTREAHWQVTPNSIACVGNWPTNKGLVTARRIGHATIRARIWNRLGTASLSVSGP